MRVAVLGATSQIARDLVISFSGRGEHTLALYARRPDAVTRWLEAVGLAGQYTAADFASFTADQQFDAIVNFVGVGNPVQAAAMGASILDVTLKHDELALAYLQQHPDCRYIFLSSGAAYGAGFVEAVDEGSKAAIPINNLQSQDWYGIAKLYAEARHRSLPDLPIVDVRVFSYFSRTQDLTAGFFISDILRALKSGETMVASPDNIVRDYIGPAEFFELISRILLAPRVNDVVDGYTLAPVDKLTLLDAMRQHFGLAYEVSNASSGVNATGAKMNYFSKNYRARRFGYLPFRRSLDVILEETHLAKLMV